MVVSQGFTAFMPFFSNGTFRGQKTSLLERLPPAKNPMFSIAGLCFFFFSYMKPTNDPTWVAFIYFPGGWSSIGGSHMNLEPIYHDQMVTAGKRSLLELLLQFVYIDECRDEDTGGLSNDVLHWGHLDALNWVNNSIQTP